VRWNPDGLCSIKDGVAGDVG